jgi:hypothetical protein
VTSVHDRPTASELVQAVREFLEQDVMEATEGRVQFHTRVAINALGMVERELREGRAMTAEHDARLAALGFADDDALARAIRTGEVDDRWDEVVTAVREATLEKLRIANPDYMAEDEGSG